jgi:inorganic pyrophosphatase
MVCEVPRWSNAKLEVCDKTVDDFYFDSGHRVPSSLVQISKTDALNPIQQDEKKGAPRFVHNCFPHHGYIWNYGAIPQV